MPMSSQYTVPRAKQSPAAIVSTLASPNPSVTVQSQVIVSKGFDPCANGSSFEASEVESTCPEGYIAPKDHPTYCFSSYGLGYSSGVAYEQDPCAYNQASRLFFRESEPDIESAFRAFLTEHPGKTFYLRLMQKN